MALPARPLLARPDGPPYQPFLIRPRAFTAPQCRRIVELGRTLPAERGALVDQGPEGVGPVRDSMTAWLGPSPDTDWIFERLAGVVEWANERYRFDLVGFEEDLQFTTYHRRGAHYGWHQDGLDGAVASRKLSVVVQLSDPESYRGGELEFLGTAEERDPGRRREFHRRSTALGTAVVFPSFEFHRVRPLRSGVRRSLVAWVGGPPFR